MQQDFYMTFFAVALLLLLIIAGWRIVQQKQRITELQKHAAQNAESQQTIDDLTAQLDGLQSSFEQVSSVVDASVDIVFWMELVSTELGYINHAGCERLGFSEKDLLSMRLVDFDAELDSERWYSYMAILKTGSPLVVESIFQTADRQRFPVEMSMRVQHLESEKRVIVFARDISARKQDERQLRRSEERMAAIMDGAGDAIVVTNKNFEIETFSVSAENIFEYESYEVIGKSLMMLFPKADWDALQKMFRHGDSEFSEKTVLSGIELTGMRKEGSEFPLEISINKVFVENEQMRVCIMRDVTERYYVQEELQMAKARAEAGELSKTNFLANMSHEVRTPLNAIIGMTQLVLRGEKDVKSKRYLSKSLESAHALLEIMNDILEYARIDTNQLVVDEMAFSLQDMLLNLKNKVEKKSGLKKLQVNLELPDGFTRSVMGDALKIRRVLTNLASNAVKFSDTEGKITIGAKVLEQADHRLEVMFFVSDNGIGIEQERQKDLFQTFEQIDSSTTRHFGGIGLGLAISRSLVEMMGGRIWVKSEVGHGSTFSFALPLKLTVQSTPEHAQHDNLNIVEMDKRFENVSVLLMSGNLQQAGLITDMLQEFGMLVTVVNSRDNLYALLEERYFDLFLVDCPSMESDIAALLRVMRRKDDGNKIPLLGLDSEAGQAPEEWKEAGMLDVLVRPFNAEDMLAWLSRFVKPLNVADDKMENSDALVDDDRPDFSSLKHINIDQALVRTRNKVSFLDKLLQIFVGREKGFPDRFEKALNSDDWDGALREAHSLKGVAANLGAEALRAKALALEVACKDRVDDIQGLATEVERELLIVLEGIEAYLASRQHARMPDNVDDTHLLDLLQSLEEFIESDNIKAIDIASQLSQKLKGEELKAMANDIASILSGYDFESAQKQLDKLKLHMS